MTLDSPLVSAIIPVFNGERYLAEAIDSILRQGYERLEVVIVDDGSTDGTAAIARQAGPGTRCVHRPHSGLPATRNAGLREARGELIAFLDADDLWSDDKLALQAARMAAEPAPDIVMGRTQVIRPAGDGDTGPRFEPWGQPTLAPSMGCALVRRTAFDRLGAFDEARSHNDDVDWFLRARENGARIVVHGEVTQFYRRHGDNITNDQAAATRDLLRALHASLARRRRAGRGTAGQLPALEDAADLSPTKDTGSTADEEP